jgi:hypothetical protein
MFVSGKKLYAILSVIGGALAAAKDECKFVNSLLGKDDSYDCCAEGYPNVKCSAEHVTYINLSGKSIEMAFPALGDLPQLAVLDLSNNKISGSLPDLSSLTSLTSLNVSGNQIEGTIPDSVEKLVNLKVFDASNNKITGMSDKIATLPLLTELILSKNSFEGAVPTCIKDFQNLKTLDLSNNKLSGAIPDAVTYIKTLVTLNLSNNALDENNIPSNISKLTNLRYLDVSHNKLVGEIPTKELEKLTNIASLNFESNLFLVGKVPNMAYDDNDYTCKFKDTNLCFVTSEKRLKCEYTDLDCTVCKENASLKDDICRCNDGFSGAGYVLCSDGSDSNLNTGSDSAGFFRTSFSSVTIATVILLASYILYLM